MVSVIKPSSKQVQTSKKILPCPVCSSKESKLMGKHGKYLLLDCGSCGLRYSSPMQEPPNEFYTGSYLYNYRTKTTLAKDLANSMLRRDWRFRTAIADISKRIKKTKGEKILDVGCGEGGFLYLLKERGFSVFGVDIDQRGVEIAKKDFGLQNVKVVAWQELPKLNWQNTFSVVTLFDTLEHVSDPLQLLRFISSLLADNGCLYISVPSYERQPRLFDPEADFPPHHLTLWTRKGLEIALEKTGFKKMQIIEKPFGGEDLQLHFIWWLKRRRSEGKQDKKANEKTFVTRPSAAKAFLKSLSLVSFKLLAGLIKFGGTNRGQTYLVIAQK